MLMTMTMTGGGEDVKRQAARCVALAKFLCPDHRIDLIRGRSTAVGRSRHRVVVVGRVGGAVGRNVRVVDETRSRQQVTAVTAVTATVCNTNTRSE